MNELIKVKENVKGEQTVDARELHKFMEVSERFNDWIVRKLTKYGFIEGRDYYCKNSNRSDGLPGKPRKQSEFLFPEGVYGAIRIR